MRRWQVTDLREPTWSYLRTFHVDAVSEFEAYREAMAFRQTGPFNLKVQAVDTPADPGTWPMSG